MTLFNIKQKVSERLESRKKNISLKELILKSKPTTLKPLRPFFPYSAINIIAEVKRASPSEGDLKPKSDPVSVATEYLNCGAKALSVLTEPDFFKGHLDFIFQIKKAKPESFVLMKDFIFDEYQIIEGVSAGADAILLIVAMLDPVQFKDLHAQAKGWGLNPLVEVHSEAEMEVALKAEVKFIGVNNRNLNTMKIDLEISKKLAQYKANVEVLISESGLSTGAQLRDFSKMGFDGFLIGTQFMKAESPGKRLAEILKEARQ
jgi:indole-3-glycerol phosphate synthase